METTASVEDGPDPATGISFTGRGGPVVDPEKSAALKAARIRQLRDGV